MTKSLCHFQCSSINLLQLVTSHLFLESPRSSQFSKTKDPPWMFQIIAQFPSYPISKKFMKKSCGVFVDLQKAFNTVDHEILISKLDHYGIRGSTKAWFKSYLSNRSQYVSISGTKSHLKSIKHGVPQGSVLGPLLFLVYINDLHHSIRTSETYHFADDTHLLNLSQTVWSLCGRVNSDFRILVSWLNANKIYLNASKTEFIIFRSNRRPLDTIPRIEISGQRLTPSKTIK